MPTTELIRADHVGAADVIETAIGTCVVNGSETRDDGTVELDLMPTSETDRFTCVMQPADLVNSHTSPEFRDLARRAAGLRVQLGSERGRVTELEKSIETTRRRDEVYMARLVADAHEYADHNDLCERFDDFMESHDLPRRSASYAVTVDVEQRITVYVTAASEEDAERMVAGMDDLHEKVIDDIRDNGLDSASYSAERD